jgi:hypothetical protein
MNRYLVENDGLLWSNVEHFSVKGAERAADLGESTSGSVRASGVSGGRLGS